MSMILNLVRLPEATARAWAGASDEEIYEMLDEGVHPQVDLGKSWHVLHFLLTGEIASAPAPLGFLLSGGEPMGEDMGYGPGRVFFPPEVAQIDGALSSVTEAGLKAACRPEAMTELYPWNPKEDDEKLEYYLPYFETLQDFVRASRGSALLVYLN